MSDTEKMDDAEFQSLVTDILVDCAKFTDSELSDARATASDYYQGKPFGNEVDGRSQVVLTEVRDAVQGILPSFMRLFFGPERVVEFAPKTAKAVDKAKQASDYVQFVYAEDNPGFLITHSVLKDGLVKRLGVAKWGWDKSAGTKTTQLENLTREQLESLGQDDTLKITRAHADQFTGNYTAEVTYSDAEGRARVWAVPPEEFIFSRNARSIDDALMVAHRTEKTAGELLSLGVSQKDIDAHGSRDLQLRGNPEEIVRQPSGNQVDDPEAGEANDLILYCEAYPRLDFDGDGVAELRRVCTIGPTFHVVSNTPTDERPFALFCPDPEPHTLIGGSWADRTMDMQRVKSFVLRSTLDSLALSLHPRTAFVEGRANLLDVMNTELGAPIRIKEQGAVMPFVHPFVGADALPVLSMLSDVVESRTGQRKGTVGLDGDALQSTTKDGVNTAIESSLAQTELVARIFAETFLKPLFAGILRLLVAHQPRARLVELRDQLTAVDPREWDANMDVTVRVALGSTLIEQKVQTLIGIAQEQKDILSMLGPSNPLVTLAQYRNTLARIAELRGFPDTASFFNVVPPDWQPPPQQPQQSPEATIAQAQLQVEQMRVQKELEIKQAELTLKELQSRRDYELKVAEAASSYELQKLQIEYQFKSGNLDREFSQGQQQIEAALTQHNADNAHALAADDQAHDQTLESDQQDHAQGLAEDQQAHEQQLATQQAAQPSST